MENMRNTAIKKEYLNFEEFFSVFIQKLWLKNSSQNSSWDTRVCGYPTPSWLHNDWFYHQMCLALNSKPQWGNKQVVTLLGCCSDTLGFAGNCLVICGDQTFFQPNFGFEIKPESDWKKLLHFCNTSWPKMRPLNASFLSGLGIYSASLPSRSKLANFFSKNR